MKFTMGSLWFDWKVGIIILPFLKNEFLKSTLTQSWSCFLTKSHSNPKRLKHFCSSTLCTASFGNRKVQWLTNFAMNSKGTFSIVGAAIKSPSIRFLKTFDLFRSVQEICSPLLLFRDTMTVTDERQSRLNRGFWMRPTVRTIEKK